MLGLLPASFYTNVHWHVSLLKYAGDHRIFSPPALKNLLTDTKQCANVQHAKISGAYETGPRSLKLDITLVSQAGGI